MVRSLTLVAVGMVCTYAVLEVLLLFGIVFPHF